MIYNIRSLMYNVTPRVVFPIRAMMIKDRFNVSDSRGTCTGVRIYGTYTSRTTWYWGITIKCNIRGYIYQYRSIRVTNQAIFAICQTITVIIDAIITYFDASWFLNY